MKHLISIVLAIGLAFPIFSVAEDETMKRSQTDLLVVHCSATTPSMTHVDAALIDEWHRARGWHGIGYHAVIKRDGTLEFGRHFDDQGAHVAGYNHRSVGICLVGGIDEDGNSACNFEPEQLSTLRLTLQTMLRAYPTARLVGHRDLSPDADGDGFTQRDEWLKDCPCIDALQFFNYGKAVFA